MNAQRVALPSLADAPSDEAIARIAFNSLDQYSLDEANRRHAAVRDAMLRFGLRSPERYSTILKMVHGLEQRSKQEALQASVERAAPAPRRRKPARWNGTRTAFTMPPRASFVSRSHDAQERIENAAPVIQIPTRPVETAPALAAPQPQPPQAPKPAESPTVSGTGQMDLPL